MIALMSDDATYEMLWDCKYCGQKKLLGLTHRFCASCGSPQDPGARYFPPDSEKVAVADHEFVGADVACPTCKASNSRRAKCCGQCGAPLDKATEVRTRDEQVRDEHAQFQQAPAAKVAQPKKSPWVPIAVFGAIVALIVVIVAALSFKKKAHLEVAGLTWERTIAIEAYVNDRRAGWCDELPSGAREVARRKEQRGSDQVADGQECKVKRKDKGDGTFKETKECTPKYKSVPKMSDKCDYEVTAWKVARSLRASGAKESAPSWPAAPSLRLGSCLGCERTGARAETYIVTVKDIKTGTSDECKVGEPKWQSLKVGQAVVGNRAVVTGLIDCGSVVPK
jgi:hypothetical protein